MEQAAGVSFAAATYGELLPEDGQLEWYNHRQHKAWVRVWFAHQELGLQPRQPIPNDLYDDDEEEEGRQESDDVEEDEEDDQHGPDDDEDQFGPTTKTGQTSNTRI